MEYFGLETGAFSQLTRKYMQEEFNDKTPDVEGIKCVGAVASVESRLTRLQILLLRCKLRTLVVVRLRPLTFYHQAARRRSERWTREVSLNMLGNCSHLTFCSVASSQWGEYKGIGVSHLDLINWTNRLKWFFWELTGSKRK